MLSIYEWKQIENEVINLSVQLNRQKCQKFNESYQPF